VQEVALVGMPDAADTTALLEALRTRYLPRAVVAYRPTGAAGEAAARAVPLLDAREPVSGAAAAYVCRSFACRMPVTTPDDLIRELDPPPAPEA
jgi:uncharacterized protein